MANKCSKLVSPEQNRSINHGHIPLDEVFQTGWGRLCSLGPGVMGLWSGTLIPGAVMDNYFVPLSFCYSKRFSSEVCDKKGKCLKASMRFCSLSLHQRNRAGKDTKKRKVRKFCFYLGDSMSVPRPQLV